MPAYLISLFYINTYIGTMYAEFELTDYSVFIKSMVNIFGGSMIETRFTIGHPYFTNRNNPIWTLKYCLMSPLYNIRYYT